ncbi:MAG: cation-transporting P-type ATPase, partial [Alphaproteobacteria bacterium]
MGTARLPTSAHSATIDDLASQLDVAPASGLASAEITSRRTRFGPNALKQQRQASVFEILFNQFKSPIVLMLLGATVLAFSVREWIDGAAIIAVLVLNTLIGFFTELRALRSMEALQRLSSRSVRVRRDGGSVVISAEDLVPGDIVILDAGDVVAADLRVLSAANLAADESALT